MSNEISVTDREIQLFDRISATEKHKSDNHKTIQLAEIAMSERIAGQEIKSKSHHLEQEKEFRLTNTKRLYWLLSLFFMATLAFIFFLINSGNKELVIPIFSFIAGALGGFGYGKSR